MSETLTVISERVDDIPVLLAQLEPMGIQALLDEHLPSHGNWQGLSLGWVGVIWLTHILSQADHRLNRVQPWAQKHLETLQQCTGQPIRALDFSDDRLGDVLRALSQDAAWQDLEQALNRRLMRVYELRPQHVRLDSTTASGYWSVTPEGLFQWGHSQDRRPDLPQVKVMLSTLDPLGMPLVTTVLPGQRADDPLYIPAIGQVRAGLGRQGLVDIGDCKLAALHTRAFTQAGGDFYLCPLAQTHLPSEELDRYLTPIWAGGQPVMGIAWEGNGERTVIATGYERLETLTAEAAGHKLTWTERRLVVRSHKQAQAGEGALRARLEKAQAAVAALNVRGRGKPGLTEVARLRQAAEAMVARYQVQGLLGLRYAQRDRPATVREEREVEVQAVVDERALAEALSLTQAVLAYRSQYIIDRGMGLLKGQPLSLTPMYLQRDDHATGLMRLLSLGLRVLTLLEFVVRRRLAAAGEEVVGLYAGNPKRATTRPTAERVLEAFQDITLTVIQASQHTRRHVTPLSELQQRLLALLGFSPDIYLRLSADSAVPP
jgi:transposase